MIRDYHNDVLTELPISIQDALPRRLQMAHRTTQSNSQHQSHPFQFFYVHQCHNLYGTNFIKELAEKDYPFDWDILGFFCADFGFGTR